MTVRRTSLMGIAAVAVIANIGLLAPAATAAPKPPTKCSYDTTTKTTTCVTSTTAGAKTYEVGQSDNQARDNSYAGTFCAVRSPNYIAYGGGYPDVSTLSAQTTTVTTSTYQGRNTNKPATGTSSVSTTTYKVETNALVCLLPLDPNAGPGTPSSNTYYAGDTAVVTH